MALPNSYNIELYAGDSKDFTIRWLDSEGNPVPELIGAEAYLGISKSLKESMIMDIQGEIDINTGEVVFPFLEEDTQFLMGEGNITRKSYLYDIEFRLFDAVNAPIGVTTLLRGKVTVTKDVRNTTSGGGTWG